MEEHPQEEEGYGIPGQEHGDTNGCPNQVPAHDLRGSLGKRKTCWGGSGLARGGSRTGIDGELGGRGSGKPLEGGLAYRRHISGGKRYLHY
jgi:hypothetical protein